MDRSLLYHGMRWQESIVVSERAVALSRSLRKRMIALVGIIPVSEKREGEPGDRHPLSRTQQQLIDVRLKAVTTFLVTLR
jgi:hypothetical protein